MIVGLSSYTAEIAQRIIVDKNIHAVILGDPFCNKRMFEYEVFSLLDIANLFVSNNIEIIYQTPKYITDRNFDKEMMLVDYLIDKFGVKKVLVQDIGVISYLKNRNAQIELIWSLWGRARLNAINEQFVKTLINLGVDSVENEMTDRTSAYEKLGLKVYSVARGVSYSTLNRECYSKYLFGNFENTCQYECRRERIIQNETGFSLTVNGFLLNEKYVKHRAISGESDEVVYALDYDDYLKCLEEENW